jgi:N-acetylglucosamine-6-phosphate deacetylase
MLVLTGARLFDGESFLDDRALVVDGRRIAAIVPHRERPTGGTERDLGGGLLAPGFIDVQVNGGGGALVNDDPSPETLLKIAEAHRPFGSVGVMPTLVTDAQELMPRAIAATREARQRNPAILGVHLEGPFLDVKRKGAHEARYIRPMTREDLELIAGADCGAVMLTVAPNRVSPAYVRELAQRGVLVSLGHAEASYAEARAALDAGARAFTHLHNAMSPLTGREPGMVGAALSDDESFVGIIADGHHVHPTTMQIAFAAKRRDRFLLITDAMPPAAGGPDRFRLQDRWIVKAEGCLRLEDGTLAGSLLTMDEAVRYCVTILGLPLADALVMASRAPAEFLRRDRDLGRLAPGYLASFVHLDDGLKVREVWVKGQSPTS